MLYLFSASLIWSFSFGLIKSNLAGMHPNLISFIRITLSFMIFLPFIKIKNIESKLKLKLILTGAIQFGLMYIAYIYSYRFLKGYEVALFTIFTPLYVSVIHDIMKKKLHRNYFLISILAISGTAIIVYKGISSADFLPGFILLQFSNVFFAWGQVNYREIMKTRKDIRDRDIFAYLYFGAMIITLISVLITIDPGSINISGKEALTLLYLGTIPSGIAFFLWNFGVRRSGIGTISILNNLKIPLAIIISMFVFGEEGNLVKVITGCSILISAMIYNEISERKNRTSISSGTSGE